jgi:hypothetical protein
MVLPFNAFYREFKRTLGASGLAFEPFIRVYFPLILVENLMIKFPLIVQRGLE